MKTILLCSLLMSLGSLSFAQQTPTHPSTSTSSTTVSTSSSSLHSVSDNDGNDVENLFIAINESDKSYKLQGEFSSKNDAAVKELLINEFGRENLQIDGYDWIWSLTSTSDEIYSIKFSTGKLRMELDKKQAVNTLTKKFIRTGQVIKELLSGENNQKSETVKLKTERLQREEQRMQLEAISLEKTATEFMKKTEVIALKKRTENLQQKVDSLMEVIKELREN